MRIFSLLKLFVSLKFTSSKRVSEIHAIIRTLKYTDDFSRTKHVSTFQGFLAKNQLPDPVVVKALGADDHVCPVRAVKSYCKKGSNVRIFLQKKCDVSRNLKRISGFQLLFLRRINWLVLSINQL